ncbi:MAG: glycoside hydrolase family 44 protein [Fimbriimonadaceae bacterium]
MIVPLLLVLAQPSAAFTVDPTQAVEISPYIYGTNFPDWEGLNTPFPFARQGGNRMSAYNWETNASNAGSDWHHQNDGYLGESDEPGWTVRRFFEPAQSRGAAVLLTVPTLGYVSADKNADGDVNQTPNYREVRFHRSLPTKPGGAFAYPPDTTDRVVYQDEFVAWVEKARSKTTPIWYSLDNEPDLWAHTHARLVPKNPGYAGIIANNVAFAGAIKAVAPDTLVFGPANYGWQGFRRFQDADDSRGQDFLDVYLAAMRIAERRTGRRLLDALDIHWYPEARGDGRRITSDDRETPGLAEARIQAPRSLWDPTYVEDSWIAESLGRKPIALLPGILDQIRRHYPGTKLAITEYNYGGSRHPSGLVAQADVLGIFGRYGIFAAANWGLSPGDSAQLAAFRAFLDFDAKGARFGDVGLGVQGGDPAAESLYAARDRSNPNRLTLVAVNKTASPRMFVVRTATSRSASVRGFAARHDRPFEPGSLPVARSGGTVRFTVPAYGVATVEIQN